MTSDGLDELDYGILHFLQQDARHATPTEMAKSLPITDTTIRGRITNMEERGIIEGHVPIVNYEKAGFPFRVKFTCTASPQERERIANEALELSRVVHVEEMLSARKNIRILAVSSEPEEVNALTSQIDELGLTIESETLLRQRRTSEFSHFEYGKSPNPK